MNLKYSMLKLVSVNIQGDMNHKTVIPFLKKEMADVVCLQELFEDDIKIYEEELGMVCSYAPECYIESFINADGKDKKFGVGIFAKEIFESNYECIVGAKDLIPLFEFKNSQDEPNTTNVVLLWSEVEDKNGNRYKICTTHFTWTPLGEVTNYQLEHTNKLISILDSSLKDFILVGDLNAPRGMQAFTLLSNKYKDNIPFEYNSSIDPLLHRKKGLIHMVDGLFSSSEYKISNVSLIEGVSDHKAVIANIECYN